jgi:cell division protein FtsB
MLRILGIRKNLILLITIVFIFWMLFFDENSYLSHRELNKEIQETQKTNSFYKEQIEKDRKMIGDLQNKDSLEKFGREEYLMKRKEEEIFIIDVDSLNKK